MQSILNLIVLPFTMRIHPLLEAILTHEKNTRLSGMSNKHGAVQEVIVLVSQTHTNKALPKTKIKSQQISIALSALVVVIPRRRIASSFVLAVVLKVILGIAVSLVAWHTHTITPDSRNASTTPSRNDCRSSISRQCTSSSSFQ
jgi:hypothetical protein